jgi:hypothetical protein
MITQFTIGCSRTINLGNFESMRVEASITFSVEEGDDPATLKVEAQAALRALLEQTYKAQRGEKQKVPA